MNILNWANWEVVRVQENAHDYRITARCLSLPTACPHCGCVLNVDDYGRREQLYMDLPIHAKRVGVAVQRQRYRCRECHKTFIQPLPEMDDKRRSSRRLVAYIEQESLARTFTSISEDVGLTEGAIRAIFRDHIQALEERVVFATPTWLGIDEVHILKKPRCVLTNIQERTMIDLLKNRSGESVNRRLLKFADRNTIQLVTMDMWRPYRDAVRDVLPQAEIVVDKFHVVKMANRALEAVRKQVRTDLTPKQRRALMHDRFILLHRKHDLPAEKLLILDVWINNFPTLLAAYNLKEKLFEIWDTQQAHYDARKAYQEWEATIPADIAWAFKDVTTAVRNWDREVFNYFTHRITNAYTEAANGLAKLTQKNGRGYSFASIRAKMLYSFSQHKRPKYDKSFDEADDSDTKIFTLGVDLSTI